MTASKNSAIARQWKLDTSILDLAINRRGDWVCATLGDGRFMVVAADDAGEDPKLLPGHDGVSLSLTQDADDHAFISGGDDGRVFIIEPEVNAPTQIAEQKNKWIDHVAAAPGELRSFASGKHLFRLSADGAIEVEPKALPSSIGGLAFSPNGKRLAVSHYNGVSLFWVNAPETPSDVLEWKGSHLGLLWSPDGKTILSAMQDNAIHGWRLDAASKAAEHGNEMMMQGYAGKIHAMAFTAKGKYLATGGASQVICWPFTNGGPWNKQPLVLGGADGRLITRVAPHPRDEMVAAGFDDGMIILAPLDGRMEVMILPPIAPSGAAVTGLVWNNEADCLTASLENGALLLFTLASISRFVRGQFK